MDNILSVQRINKSFLLNQENMMVLNDINLEIKIKESICLLGYSGCGKTTLLRIICGFEIADSGKIIFNNKEYSKPSKNIIMLFQDFNQLLPWKTVLGNIVHSLKATGVEKSSTKAKDIGERILEEVGLSEYKESYPSQLSGGMKQRVAFARALVLKPSILVMDEPFASLDHMNRVKLQDMTKSMCRKYGITMLFVTHDIEEAVNMADKIVLMKPNPGTIDEILDNTYAKSGNEQDKLDMQLKILEIMEKDTHEQTIHSNVSLCTTNCTE